MEQRPLDVSAATRAEISRALDAFVAGAPQRSAGVQALRGLELTACREEHSLFPAASVIKVPMAMALYDLAAAGEISLDARIPRGELGRTVYSSVLEAFDPAHELSLAELCALMMITSDNPASDHILRSTGIAAVNDHLARIGATSSRMVVGFGDDVVGNEGRKNVTTVADTLTILRHLYATPAYAPIIRAMKNNVRNTRIPLRLPDTLPIAHKTGSLSGVAHDAGILYGQRVDAAVVFLTKDEPDTNATSIDMGECAKRVWAALGEPVD